MKRRLAVLGAAIMAAVAITACSGKDVKTTTTAEVVAQVDAIAEITDGEAEDAGAASDSETAAESQPSESTPQEATLLEETEDVSHAGVELEQSEIKPFVEKVQKTVVDRDVEALAGLCVYPVYISLGEGRGKEIADELVLLEMDTGQIFTESLLKGIADMDVGTLEQLGAGAIMDKESSIIFNDVDGQAAIIGTNLNQSMSEHAMSGHTVKKSRISR